MYIDTSRTGILNSHHAERYDKNSLRFQGGASIGKPVVPVYRFQHFVDKRIAEMPRGMDARHESMCHRNRQQRDKENTAMILDRQLN